VRAKTKSEFDSQFFRHVRPLAVLFTLLILSPAKNAQAQVTISGVSPSPLVGPKTSTNSPYKGYFFITGQNFPQNAFVTTDGPLLLIGNPATITSTLIV